MRNVRLSGICTFSSLLHVRPLVLLLVLALCPPARSQQADRDPLRQVLDEHDKQLQAAKKQFDLAAQRANDNALKRLIAQADGALKVRNDDVAARAFKEVLRIDRSNTRAREFFDRQRKLDEVLTQLTLEWTPIVTLPDPQRENQVFYECLLGRYKGDAEWITAVTLVVPDGTNIFNATVSQRTAMATGDPSQGKIAWYEGTGSIMVPADGMYLIVGPTRTIKIDDKELPPNTYKPTEVPLRKGVYGIHVAADSRYISGVAIRIVEQRTGNRIPIFNSLAEIKRFLRPPTEPQASRRIDISRWSPDVAVPLSIALP